jgi:hypothetical protein
MKLIVAWAFLPAAPAFLPASGRRGGSSRTGGVAFTGGGGGFAAVVHLAAECEGTGGHLTGVCSGTRRRLPPLRPVRVQSKAKCLSSSATQRRFVIMVREILETMKMRPTPASPEGFFARREGAAVDSATHLRRRAAHAPAADCTPCRRIGGL